MRPYFIPERSRTKSENAEPTSYNSYPETSLLGHGLYGNTTSMMDTSCDTNTNSLLEMNGNILAGAMVAPCMVGRGAFAGSNRSNLIKKSKSLEDISKAAKDNIDGSQPSHEMEFVSSRIQKLKVQD